MADFVGDVAFSSKMEGDPEQAGKEGKKDGEEYGERFSKGFEDRLRNRLGKIHQRLRKTQKDAGEDAGEEMGNAAGDGFYKRLERKVSQGVKTRARRMGNSVGDSIGEAIADRVEIAMERSMDRVVDRLDNLTTRIESAGGRGGRGPRRPDRDVDTLSALPDRLGTAFGRGGRNDFIHLMGSSVRLLTLSMVGLIKTGQTMGKVFYEGFNAAADGANFLQKSLSGLGAVGSRAVGSVMSFIPTLIVAIPIIVASMSALVSVMSALVGIVTALTASIVSGLVGALAVAGGLLTAIVLAAGLAVTAFMSMTDAQKKMLKDAFEPLMDALVGLGQIMMEDIAPAFKTWSENLQAAVELAIPLAEVMGDAFATAGNTLTEAFSGPGFQRMMAVLETHLPTIVTNLSTFFAGFMNGMMGMFAAIMPYVTRFTTYLADLGTRFSEWANSATGQNAIVDFVDRALESFESLWGFTREFFGWFSDVFFSSEAQSAGNDLFDGLKSSFEGFRDAIDAAQASGTFKQWFEDAIEFGGDLKEVIIGIKDLWQDLNSSGVLDAVGEAFRAVGNAISFIADMVDILLTPFEGLVEIVRKARKLFEGSGEAAEGFGAGIDSITSAADPAVSALQTVATWVGNVIDRIDDLAAKAGGLSSVLGGIASMIPGLSTATQALNTFNGLKNATSGGGGGSGGSETPGTSSSWRSIGPYAPLGPRVPKGPTQTTKTLDDLIASGQKARSETTKASSGGGGGTPNPMPNPSPGGTKSAAKKWVNPYIKFANQLIKEGPTLRKEMRKAVRTLNKEIAAGLREAALSTDASAVNSSMREMAKSMRAEGRDLVGTAQDALNSAAKDLAGAANRKEAKKALKDVKKAQKDLDAALLHQRRLKTAAKIVADQKIVTSANVRNLVAGLNAQNATLADFAAAREHMADLIEDANRKLEEAIQIRDSFRDAVESSIKAFGGLLTAQAQVINGVEQALTAGDVTSNLRDRLGQIRKFRDDMQKLLALGLSEAAYQQLWEGGVEGSGATVEALLQGGYGSVQETNFLIKEIDTLAAQMGKESSNHLYQAGVDAAQGLVNGLMSRDKELAAAAANLGNMIADQVKRALGISSPSKVMIDITDNVGNTTVNGLQRQKNRVADAASDFLRSIPASAEVAAYQAAQRSSVSVNTADNGGRAFRDLVVQTPTENPEAVAMEVLNEVVGRLP